MASNGCVMEAEWCGTGKLHSTALQMSPDVLLLPLETSPDSAVPTHTLGCGNTRLGALGIPGANTLLLRLCVNIEGSLH